MHVDHLYKGHVEETVELFDDGMCDGPAFEAGRQYLMYTTVLPTGDIPSRGCTRSRAVEAADEDLEFLKQYSAGRVITHVSGSVSLQPDPSEDRSSQDGDAIPMKDVRVTVLMDGRHFSTHTNSLGQYSFTRLPPGEYEITAEFPGHRQTDTPEEFTLYPNGCIESDLTMKVARRVKGVVQDENGTPVPEIMVEMVPVKRKPERWRGPILLAITDEQGRYAIDGIPPGDYYLGINVGSTPVKERPYARTYYPNTPDIAQALQIAFTSSPLMYDLDLRLLSKLPIVTIQGRVLNPDSTPPRSQDYPEITILEPGLSGQIQGGSVAVDAEGRFEFELCDGITYSAFASAGPRGAQRYSATVTFTPTKDNNRLLLILDKSASEFEKARVAMGANAAVE